MSSDDKIKESLYRENEKLRRDILLLENDLKRKDSIISQYEKTIENYISNRSAITNALQNTNL